MCRQNHYHSSELQPAVTRLSVAVRPRDEHFGNGRTVRNTFENAIRRLANRISGEVPITKELLSELHPEDIALPAVPAKYFARAEDPKLRFAVRCPGCQQESRIPGEYLGQSLQCKKCSHKFLTA
jgi:hypothetical protein